MRKAGILMPVASLPSRHGCGNFGPQAYHFIDEIKDAGFSLWQILPLNPLAKEFSPYAAYSSWAIDEIYISLDTLYKKGLIDRVPSFHAKDEYVDFAEVKKLREPYLRKAFQNFVPDLNYATFAGQEWMKIYSVYMALRKKNHEVSWTEWEDDEKNWPLENKLDLKPLENEILYQIFLQYELYLEWKDLKQYANDRGIEIMGDMPFYVGLDSSDCWGNRKNFLLDEEGQPSFIAGVPPDYFSATGQRWGNPIYDWEYMEKDKFSFWTDRLSYCGKLMDIVRVDHFRAFDTYWKIPSSCPTAIEGEWIEAPGYKLFDTLFAENPEMKIVAEDLGDLRHEVHVLRDHYKLPGMRVMQFSFTYDEIMHDNRSTVIVYTGTHDNAPLEAWYREMPNSERRQKRSLMRKAGYVKKSFVDNVIDYALNRDAETVIIPMQDWLHTGKKTRINVPGKVLKTNWSWRMKDLSAFIKKKEYIAERIDKAGRKNPSVL